MLMASTCLELSLIQMCTVHVQALSMLQVMILCISRHLTPTAIHHITATVNNSAINETQHTGACGTLKHSVQEQNGLFNALSTLAGHQNGHQPYRKVPVIYDARISLQATCVMYTVVCLLTAFFVFSMTLCIKKDKVCCNGHSLTQNSLMDIATRSYLNILTTKH